MHGKDYENDLSFDPSKLLETDKFGIAPTNTTLTIAYRTNTADNVNLLSNGFKMKIASDPNVAEKYIYMAWASTPFKTATAR